MDAPDNSAEEPPAAEPVAVEPTVADPHAAAEPVQAPLPALPTDVPEAHRCEVEVLEVLSDTPYRGHPNTPQHLAWVDGLDAESMELYLAESHGAGFRECRYAVGLGAQRYTFSLTWDTTWQDLPEDWCARASDHAGAQVQRVTLGCAELHRGAWWGQDLVALD